MNVAPPVPPPFPTRRSSDLERGRDLDLAQETLGTDRGAEIGSEHLDRHLTAVLQVVGEIDRGHSSLTQRALQAVAVGQRLEIGRASCRERVEHPQCCLSTYK